MKLNNENSVSDLIYLFVDRETDSTQQKALFEALADNPELQSEFQQAIEIHHGFAADKESVYPSSELTKSVFSAAGFSNPMPGSTTSGAGKGTAAATGSKPIGFVGFFSKHLPQILTTAAGVAITTGLFLGVINPMTYNDNYNEDKTNQTNINNNTNETSVTNSNLPPTMSSEELPANNIRTIPLQTKYVIRYVKDTVEKIVLAKNEDKLTNQTTTEILPEKENQNLTNHDINSVTRTQSDLLRINPFESFKYNNFAHLNSGIFAPSLAIPSDLGSDNNLNLSLEYSNISGLTYFPNRTIDNPGSKNFNNYTFAISYHFDKNNSVSIHCGKEELQMYKLSWDNGDPVFTKQNDIFWGGGGIRHIMNYLDWFGPIKPYGEIILGGSQYGFLGKSIIGLNYHPENMLSFSIGFEATGQTYTLQKKIYLTGKGGMVYSLGIHF
jgi:hypothetical protein